VLSGACSELLTSECQDLEGVRLYMTSNFMQRNNSMDKWE